MSFWSDKHLLEAGGDAEALLAKSHASQLGAGNVSSSGVVILMRRGHSIQHSSIAFDIKTTLPQTRRGSDRSSRTFSLGQHTVVSAETRQFPSSSAWRFFNTTARQLAWSM
jgi:hypothetical protein